MGHIPGMSTTLLILAVSGLITGLYDHTWCYLTAHFALTYPSSSDLSLSVGFPIVPVVGIFTSMLPYIGSVALIVVDACQRQWTVPRVLQTVAGLSGLVWFGFIEPAVAMEGGGL